MVGLVSALVGERAYEVVRFVIMLALLVLAAVSYTHLTLPTT